MTDPKPESKPILPAEPVADEKTVAPKTLTPDEQMALFEKDLKENDWGHQPC